ncbi:MAG: response regulator transcription factor [Dehalococcoidia bacterium]
MVDVKVCVVAPFEPLRLGLVSTINAEPDMQVVGEARDLAELAALAAFREADVLLIDSVAVEGTGRATYAQINEWLPVLKVLFLGTSEDARNITPEDIPMYMRLHTLGFLLKDGPTSRLTDAIRLVANGTFVCETELIRHILTRLSRAASYAGDESNGQNLTDREMEVLTLVTRGMSNKEIAHELFLSEGTVKAHVSHIMSKLNVDRRTDLVRHALMTGLVRLDEETTSDVSGSLPT